MVGLWTLISPSSSSLLWVSQLNRVFFFSLVSQMNPQMMQMGKMGGNPQLANMMYGMGGGMLGMTFFLLFFFLYNKRRSKTKLVILLYLFCVFFLLLFVSMYRRGSSPVYLLRKCKMVFGSNVSFRRLFFSVEKSITAICFPR